MFLTREGARVEPEPVADAKAKSKGGRPQREGIGWEGVWGAVALSRSLSGRFWGATGPTAMGIREGAAPSKRGVHDLPPMVRPLVNSPPYSWLCLFLMYNIQIKGLPLCVKLPFCKKPNTTERQFYVQLKTAII